MQDLLVSLSFMLEDTSTVVFNTMCSCFDNQEEFDFWPKKNLEREN